ncbi:hypothetical protein Hs30E_06220 [Lactococcus hodotermopsidis]|uniref:Uncharacterized protein n=1 Tax=Pseudolactococcus hodotermopsidis TaxID=2709157 RepID=A0A6A0BC51_9LACT|nr:hypothetical protein [Lactococcus hodotermopsidis]GFH42071.1 hypothetical protein Hs30E_06220 [Lactococcus hodotermopsidis]
MNSEYVEIKWKKSKLLLVVVLLIGITVYYTKGRNNVINRYVEDKTLKLQLFPNVKGVVIKSELQDNYFSEKTYKKLEITIPSFASVNDDTGKNTKLATQVIDRDKLDSGIEEWLKTTYDSNEAKKMTDHIVIYYRDDKIIDETFSK